MAALFIYSFFFCIVRWSHATEAPLNNSSILDLYFTLKHLVRSVALGPKGQPVPEPFEEPPDGHHVEVNVLSEVGANVRVRVHQGAVEGGPAYADHHGNQTQQQQDQARISTHLVCEEECNSLVYSFKTNTTHLSRGSKRGFSRCAVHDHVFRIRQTLPGSTPSSGSLKRTLRLEFGLVAILLGGGRPSSDALLLFRMETRPSGEEF